jgi:REP element-mobilizing transposase RayT
MAKKPSEGQQQRKARSPFEKLRTTGSSAYRLFVLVAFYARAKKPLFDAEVTALFAQALPEVCRNYEYELIAYRVMANQVHLVLGIKPTDAVADVISNIKRSTAHRLFEGIPRLETGNRQAQLLGGRLLRRDARTRPNRADAQDVAAPLQSGRGCAHADCVRPRAAAASQAD